MSKSSDRLTGVVHPQKAAGALEIVGSSLEASRSIFRDKLHDEFSWSVNNCISGHILITMSVSADDDGLLPAWNKERHIVADDGLSEDGTIEDVADGSIGRLPHLLQLELLHTVLIRSNCGALDSNLVLLDGISRLNCHLIISGITILNREIVVLQVNIYVRLDVLQKEL